MSILNLASRIYYRLRGIILQIPFFGFPTEFTHITRYSMYKRLAKFKQTPSSTAKVLSISHSEQLCSVLGLNQTDITIANYPDHNFLDLSFPDNSFDYVISDQVLEHVEGDPQKAMDETLRVLKPGGLSIHTTCFMNPIHEYPVDLWRFTPYSLKFLCSKFSEILEVGGWGNQYIPTIIALNLRMQKVPKFKWHPYNWLARYNHPEWPIVTWVIAKK